MSEIITKEFSLLILYEIIPSEISINTGAIHLSLFPDFDVIRLLFNLKTSNRSDKSAAVSLLNSPRDIL
ncbi:MAG: hypothetical protein AMXMBFR48_03060 [Ignavibacteriales bacterium]